MNKKKSTLFDFKRGQTSTVQSHLVLLSEMTNDQVFLVNGSDMVFRFSCALTSLTRVFGQAPIQFGGTVHRLNGNVFQPKCTGDTGFGQTVQQRNIVLARV